MRRFWVVLVAVLLMAQGGGPVSRKAPTKIPNLQYKQTIPLNDPRVEQVARAICIARGIDPDHVGAPFPDGPIWEFFIPDAILFLNEYDAAKPREN